MGETITDWLQSYGCSANGRISQYDHARYNLLVNQTRFPLHDGSTPRLGASGWSLAVKCAFIEGLPEAIDFDITFTCVSGELPQASVSVDLEFYAWSGTNYVLLPSAAYNGNRFLSRRIPYSPKLYYVQDIGVDKPIILTDVPKLNEADGPSRIQERSGSMAVPAVGFRSEQTSKGCWVMTRQGNELGDYGLSIEETRGRDRAIISLTSPVVRELYNYRNCDMRFPSVDTPKDFKAGDAVTISFRLHFFNAPEVQSLFDRFAAIRKSPLRAFAPLREREVQNTCTLPYSACLALQEEKFNRENFVPEHGYYSVGPRTNFLQDWQIGWTGGMISTYPLLFAGNEQTRANVLRNFDWLFSNGISPSGFFWDCGANGTQWFGGDIRKPHTGNWHLIRKSGDAVFFIIKQFLLMKKLCIVVKPAWREGVKRVCDAFVKVWTDNHQFGQFVDSLTGEIRVGGSTSGAIVPAALILASRYFDMPEYLEVARQSGEHFYQTYTRAGMSCGGPGDACQNPDSESWYALIESYVALAEGTCDRVWFERARETTRQFSTWVVAYDFAFPPESTFCKAGIRTTGAVYANTQNKHAAPGLCTFSGLGFLKLFRATGDRLPLDLLHDIAHNMPQYLPHPLKPLGDALPGRMCERVNMTDWEGPERIGETLHMSTWAETSLMLTAIEIPGLYVQPDQALVVAFDNIEAEIINDTPQELTIRLSNPTPAPAHITVMAERYADTATPLQENALLGTRVLKLQPGEVKTVAFEKER